ncbi:MAG TPA: hypothetical protein VFL59_00695 [Candidatus Nanopelagicales bacterium]|nr:hypothetical protein [Candidatus Nanopelagicales bacterium]
MRGRILAAGALVTAVAAGAVVAFVQSPATNAGSTTPTTSATSSSGSSTPSQSPSSSPSPTDTPTDTPQSTEGFPPITRLKPGEQAPQFVVLSFDGACKHELWQHYMELARANDAHFTFFLSGLCLVPDAQRKLYHPPGKPVGYSAIGFGQASLIPQRIKDITQAYDEGNEIGTHFLGHFCDAKGVGTWTASQWTSELDQAVTFLDNWKSINGNTDPSLQLPFSADIWKGARTPCLLGKPAAMYPVWKKFGFAYDASRTGTLTWPKKVAGYGLWEFPLQRIKVVGYNKTNLSMDYNLLYVQNKGKIDAPPATCAKIENSTYLSLMQALKAVHTGNRAPFFIGNHFNQWACGAYVNALTSFVTDAHAQYPDVHFVTFEYLTRWLAAQDPKVLAALQKKPAPRY